MQITLIICCTALLPMVSPSILPFAVQFEQQTSLVPAANPPYYALTPWSGLDRFATVSVQIQQISPQSSPLLVTMFNINQWNYISSITSTNTIDVCTSPSSAMKVLNGNVSNVTFFITTTDDYRLFLLQCSSPAVIVTGYVTLLSPLVNPSPNTLASQVQLQHLTNQQIPFLNFYLGLSYIYAIFLFFWVIYLAFCFLYRKKSSIGNFQIPMHIGVSVFMVLKTVSVFFTMAMYNSLSLTGFGSTSFSLAHVILDNLSMAVILAIVLLFSFGYSLFFDKVAVNVTRRELSQYILFYCLYVAVSLSDGMCDVLHTNTDNCSSLDIVSFMSVGVLILLILLAINRYIYTLASLCGIVEWSPQHPSYYALLKLIKIIRFAIFLFLFLPIFVKLVILTLLGDVYVWLSNITDELMVLFGLGIYLYFSSPLCHSYEIYGQILKANGESGDGVQVVNIDNERIERQSGMHIAAQEVGERLNLLYNEIHASPPIAEEMETNNELIARETERDI